MLLLSSATRILATELPPMHPHKRTAALGKQPYSAIGASGNGAVNAKCLAVCRKGTRPVVRLPLPGDDFFQPLFLLAGRFLLRIRRGVVSRLGVGVGGARVCAPIGARCGGCAVGRGRGGRTRRG